MPRPHFVLAQQHVSRQWAPDVTDVLKALHKVVNEAIQAQEPGDDHAEGLTVDLSRIDFAKLRDEFSKVPRKHATLKDIRDVVEAKLAMMLQNNPLRMDYYRKYQEIIADYNREKDRVTVEDTFAQLVALAGSMDIEQRRAAEEGLSDEELALFDLLFKDSISRADRGAPQTGQPWTALVHSGDTPAYGGLDPESVNAGTGQGPDPRHPVPVSAATAIH